MRVVPIVIPTSDQREQMEALVDEAITNRLQEIDINDPIADFRITSNESPRPLQAVVEEIDELVEEIYGVR
jgi:hypothetical protein